MQKKRNEEGAKRKKGLLEFAKLLKKRKKSKVLHVSDGF